jgi:tetratricopeptide (TPR) repeat protein
MSRDPGHYQSKTTLWALVSGVFVAVLLLFLPSVLCGFVNLDDPVYVTGNETVRAGITTHGLAFAFSSVSAVYWHPVTWLSHMLDCSLFGLNPGPHHFTSVLLHAANAVLLLLLLSGLTGRLWLSVLAAMLWAIHPLRVESVTWIAERKDVLSGFFGLAALLAYGWYVESPSGRRYIAAAGTFTLGLMSKPVLVTLPAILLLLDYWPLRRALAWPKLVLEKVPLLFISVAASVITFVGQNRAGAMSLVDVPVSNRVQNAAVSYFEYLLKMIWPSNLACHYPYPAAIRPAKVALSVGALALLTALAVWQRKRRPYLVFGWFWFLGTLLPMIGLVQVGRQAMADRFTYWPMIGLVVAAVWLAGEQVQSKRSCPAAVKAGAIGLAASLALITHQQIAIWRDSVTLFEHALRAGGDNEYIRGNLATTLMERDQLSQAEPHLLAAIRAAPNVFQHHYNLARVRLRLGRFEDAAFEAAEATRLAPQEQAPRQLWATVLLRLGDYESAERELDAAVRRGFEPTRAAIMLNDTAASLAQRRHFADAESLLRKAVDFDPRLAKAQKNLTLVLLDQGRAEEARTQLREALAVVGPHPDLLSLAGHLPAF